MFPELIVLSDNTIQSTQYIIPTTMSSVEDGEKFHTTWFSLAYVSPNMELDMAIFQLQG